MTQVKFSKDIVQQELKININSKKCFIFDLDGTIIFNNQRLSKENDMLLNSIIDAGHDVLFATGRSYRDFKLVMPDVWHNCPMTLFSGSLSLDKNGGICHNLHLAKSSVDYITGHCFSNKYPFVMDNISHYFYPSFEHGLFDFIESQVKDYRITEIDKILNTNIYKILILDMESYQHFSQYAVDNNLTIKHHSYDSCFDIVAKNCNKYNGLLPLVTNYKKEDVFVFGNDYNDYEMLKNFPNSIVFGGISKLAEVSKLIIPYNNHQHYSFATVINTILDK